jgi:beta-N-acetylhexosaminidase
VLVTVAAVAAAVTIVALMLTDGDDSKGVGDTTPLAGTTSTQQQAPAETATTPVAPPPAAPKQPVVSAARMIGQKIMVGFREHATAPPALLADVRKGRVGGVILFGENNGGANGYSSVVKQLQDAAKAGRQPALLISIDQEGGLVRRISGAPPTISPNEMGRQGATAARQQGQATGSDLRDRGINVDLAPVVDVPSSADSFLGDRTFGTSPGAVSETAGAFAAGLQEARVAATAKHYPGLGTTGARNTDEGPVAVDTSLGELTARAKPFHALADGGVKLIMVSSATYRAIDPSRPAVLSKRVVTSRLRSFFHNGVVISDDLGTPALQSFGGQIPVFASNAGVDILLYVDTAARGAYSAMATAYKSGALSPSKLKASYKRIMALKRWVAGG